MIHKLKPPGKYGKIRVHVRLFYGIEKDGWLFCGNDLCPFSQIGEGRVSFDQHRIENFTDGSQTDTAVVAEENLAAQFLFQCVHHLGDGGLGAAHFDSSLAEAANLQSGEQSSDLLMIHKTSQSLRMR